MGPRPLDGAAAERYLAGLEPFGLKLGLERMRLLCRELGNPQRSYETVHIVGTNGKTSVARMIEGLMVAADLKAGAAVSPHLWQWRERVSIAGRPLSEDSFGVAATRVREAAAAVESSGELDPGERITQFEVATAIAFLALAEAGVGVAAIEAGLGGRLDASNVIDSRLTVLTTVGLDHVEWLGETEEQIAAEKLAVLRRGTTLVLGPVSASVRAIARERARTEQATLIEIAAAVAESPGPEPQESDPSRDDHSGSATLPGRYRRLDLEIARTAAQSLLVALGHKLAAERLRTDPDLVARVARAIEIPGRLELRDGDPPLLLDVAHNPQGAAALAEALPEVVAGRGVVACLAVLADKDADGIAAALAPAVDYAVCTELPRALLSGSGRPGSTSRPAGQLAASLRGYGLVVEEESDPGRALDRATEIARRRDAVALVTGSHHLVALARDRHLCDH